MGWIPISIALLLCCLIQYRSCIACGPNTPSECRKYQWLNDTSRAAGGNSRPPYRCDNVLATRWYRLKGRSGSQMPTSCVPIKRCGTYAPGWLSGRHPSSGEISAVKVCFHWSNNCCHWHTNILVSNCGGFYVYQFKRPPACPLRYCGNSGRPSIQLSESASFVFAGKRHSISCVAKGWPLPTVRWLKNNQELNNYEINQTIVLEKTVKGEEHVNLTLRIPEVDLHDSGNYTCEATNNITTVGRTITVSVSCPPVLSELKAFPPIMGRNRNATLSCEAYHLDSHQTASYQWKWMFNDSIEIKDGVDGKYSILSRYSSPNSCQQTQGSVSLRIAKVTTQDLGQYKCKLLQYSTLLAVKDILLLETVSSKLPLLLKNLKMTTINCGRNVVLEWKKPSSESEVTGYQIILLKLVDDSMQEFNLSKTNYSKTFAVQSNTYYEVQIRAFSNMGTSLWARTQFTTTADVPETLSFSANTDGCYATLSWTIPPHNSCPITQYMVHFREELRTITSRKAIWQTESLREPNRTDYRLRLNCSSSYEVMVVAWNERGSSVADAKTVSLRTASGVPFRPIWIQVNELQCGMFVVMWSMPKLDSGGGPPTGFQVQLREGAGQWRNCTNFSSNHSCLFGDLQGKIEYIIQVRAINQKGPGKWTKKTRKTGFIGPPDAPQILNNKTQTSGKKITVHWTRPQQRNCNVTMYSLVYRVVKPTIEKMTEVNITDGRNTSYELRLQHSKKYEVTVFAWNDLGRSKRSKAWEVATAQYVPYQPVMHLNFTEGCNAINVTWSPPALTSVGGQVTGYLAQIKKANPVETWINGIEFNNPQATSCSFTQLRPNSTYHIRVKAKNKVGYGWPSKILEARMSQTGIPKKPVVDIIASDDTSLCDVIIKWSQETRSHDCVILLYTICYRQQTTYGKKEWTKVNVSSSNTNQLTLKLNCLTVYEFQVVAWNELGKSLSAIKQYATKTIRVTRVPSLVMILIFNFVGLLIILGAVLLAVCIRYYKSKSKRSVKRTVKDIQVLDHREVPPIRTEYLDVLGQGAFGKVHRAKLKDGLEYFLIGRGWENIAKRRQKIVAVKELHDNASEEQRREFMNEIELMKEIGKHQNVLSFLGCWTASKPLLLIIEYIAHGDLLHWLRRKRSQITGSNLRAAEANLSGEALSGSTPSRDANAYQDTRSLENHVGVVFSEDAELSNSFERTDQNHVDVDNEDKCDIPKIVLSPPEQEEASRDTTDGDCDDDCESFYPTDPMSFAWQIARGMSYLSEKGLVHRDLAARNILVGHGKQLKIADFGLMQEMHHEVYKVKKQKKLPIRWMAPESIYEEIFSAQSDVWSYGIVLWEVGTLGGSPYPLLSNADLVSLLRTGYRMEKPDLCSDTFYAIMTDCWKQNPDERPSFQQLIETLERLMMQDVEYFDFTLLDETKDYYQFTQESRTCTGESKMGMEKLSSSGGPVV